MTNETEQATLQDLFRALNGMRGEMNARFDTVEKRLDTQDAEIAAIRTTVDTLPPFDMVAGIENRQLAMENDVKDVRRSQNQIAGQQRQVMSKIDRAVQRLDRAGIPAE